MTTSPRIFTPAERGVLRLFANGRAVISSCAPLQPVAARLLEHGYLTHVGKGQRGALRLANKGIDAGGDFT